MKINNKQFLFNISPTRVIGVIKYFDSKKNKSIIEYTEECKINLNKNFSIIDFKKETSKALGSVSERLSKKINKDLSENFFIDKAVVFLMAPWIEYNNYNLKHESILPFLIDEKYLEKLFIKTKGNNEKIILNSDITSLKANDYNVHIEDIIGKKINKIDISFFDSLLLNFDKYFIDGTIRKHFPLINVEFLPFLPALLNQIRKIYDPRDDFIFLDISSEIIEFGIFEDRQVKKIATLPLGLNKILNDINSNFNLNSIEESKTLLKMYFNNHLNTLDNEKIEKIISSWSKKIKKDLKKLTPKYLPPYTFLVSSSYETNKLIQSLNIFDNLIFINKQILNNFVNFKYELDWDNFIALEAVYIDDILNYN